MAPNFATAEDQGQGKEKSQSSEKSKNSEEVFRVRRIAENIRRIAEYASDIGEIVLNMNIEKVTKKN